MNKHMSRADLIALAADSADRLDALFDEAAATPGKRSPRVPFAKRAEGRARRAERRAAIARKWAFLNS